MKKLYLYPSQTPIVIFVIQYGLVTVCVTKMVVIIHLSVIMMGVIVVKKLVSTPFVDYLDIIALIPKL